MAISPVTPDNTYGIGAAELAPTKKPNQTADTKAVSAPKTDSVELSRAAQARSLELKGLSAEMIALKLGLDVNAVKQYLGIAEPDEKSAAKSTYDKPKSTYVEPKSTYVEPKSTYKEPITTSQNGDQLTQDINELNKAAIGWPKLLDEPPPIEKTAAPWDNV